MPSPREINKNLIRQVESSNDKTLGLITELITRLNVSGLEIPQLYQMVLENNPDIHTIRYANIIIPLLLSIYHIETMDEALKLARQQI